VLNAVLKAKSFDKVNNHDRHDRNRKPPSLVVATSFTTMAMS